MNNNVPRWNPKNHKTKNSDIIINVYRQEKKSSTKSTYFISSLRRDVFKTHARHGNAHTRTPAPPDSLPLLATSRACSESNRK